MKNQCLFCGDKATLLCDFVIGYETVEDEYGRMVRSPTGVHTCDAPMCRKCANWHGNLFFCGKKHFMDTHDYCPLCDPLYQKGQKIRDHYIRDIEREPGMTVEQANVIRQAHWNSRLNSYRQKMQVIKGGGQLCLDL